MLSSLAAALGAGAAAVPAEASAQVGRAAGGRGPAMMVYTFPEQCVVLPVQGTPFIRARGLLATLGCRSRRVERTSTVVARGLVISVVGGERSYAFGHTVTLIVSSGPAQST